MPTTIFFLVTFGWSWLVALLAAVGLGFHPGTGGLLITAALFMLGPTLGAWAGRRCLPAAARAGCLGLAAPWRCWGWLIVAWAAPLALVAASVALSSLLPGVGVRSIGAGLRAATGSQTFRSPVPEALLAIMVVGQAAVLGSAVNAFALLSEELGWRGFLWSRWRPLGFWRSAGQIGLVWGVWHAPIIALGHNYPGRPLLGMVLMVGCCMLLAPIIHHLRDRGGTVWHASLFHGTLNATAGIGSLVLAAPDWRGNGIVGLGGFMSLALGATLIAVVRRREVQGVDQGGGQPQC